MTRIQDRPTSVSEHARAYRDDGFVILRGVFSPAELEALSAEASALRQRADLIDKHNLRCRFRSHHSTDECAFETFDPVVDIGPVCRRVAFDPRLLDVLAELYGEPACLFKDKLILKPPGMVGYEMHQDWIAWPGFPRSFLTALVPIDATDDHNGCTEVFRGYHHGGSLTPEDGEYHELPPDLVDESAGVKLILQPGDVAVFGGFTPHRSQPNRSDGWRRQLYLSYNALSDGGDQRDRHYVDFHRYLRKRYAEYGYREMYFK